MAIDWHASHLALRTAGLCQWHGGVDTDPTWRYRVSDNHVWVVVRGRGCARMRCGPVTLQRGVVIWMRPGFRYDIRQDPRRPLRFYAIHFDIVSRQRGVLPPSETGASLEYVRGLNSAFVSALMKRIMHQEPVNVARRVFHGISGQRAAQHLACLLIECEILAEKKQQQGIANDDAPGDDRLNACLDRMATRMKTNPAQIPSVSALAREAGLSLSAFSHRFKARFRESPATYAQGQRWQAATGMLRETQASIKEIAFQLGFRDTAHFAHQFRKRFNMTPSEYRAWSRERYANR
jgi:AraC-like DNA-binding protein